MVVSVGALYGANRVRGEPDASQFRGNLEVAHVQRRRFHVVECAEPVLRQNTTEVFDVKRARKAFSAQNGVVVEFRRHAPIGEDVGEIQLATWFEHARYFGEHLVFER